MEAAMGGLAGGMRTQAVRYSADALEQFKKDIDGLVIKLETAMKGPSGPAGVDLNRSQFGGGGAAWAEAQGAYSAYTNVQSGLVDLSTLLKDCLEGLSIALVMSQNGMEAMDDEVKRKMRGIYERTQEAKQQADQERRHEQTGTPAGGGSESAGDGSFQ